MSKSRKKIRPPPPHAANKNSTFGGGFINNNGYRSLNRVKFFVFLVEVGQVRLKKCSDFLINLFKLCNIVACNHFYLHFYAVPIAASALEGTHTINQYLLFYFIELCAIFVHLAFTHTHTHKHTHRVHSIHVYIRITVCNYFISLTRFQQKHKNKKKQEKKTLHSIKNKTYFPNKKIVRKKSFF